jgi:hypothetical protein
MGVRSKPASVISCCRVEAALSLYVAERIELLENGVVENDVLSASFAA